MKELSPLTCKEVFARLQDYVDRELTESDVQGVERHLELCGHCAKRFQFEESVLRELKEKLRRIQAPEGLAERVHRALESVDLS